MDKSPFRRDAKLHEEIVCDLLDKAKLISEIIKASPDAIIHLAARTDLEETSYISGYNANIEGFQNLIDAVKACPTVCRVIFTSSQLVCRVGYVPITASDYCPSTLYGQSKVIGEKVVLENDWGGGGGGGRWFYCRQTRHQAYDQESHPRALLNQGTQSKHTHHPPRRKEGLRDPFQGIRRS